MDPVTALHRLGGVATYRQLAQLCLRADLEYAVWEGAVRHDSRGRYSLPDADRALSAANAVSGAVSHLSAALHWGWEVKLVPEKPHVTVPRGRKSSQLLTTACAPHWADLGGAEIVGGVTSRKRTLHDCLRALPEDQALCVADSALRYGDVAPGELVALSDAVRGPGAVQARRVARAADGRSANPFESVLRHLCSRVAGLSVVPQVEIPGLGTIVRPDLVDERLRIVVEADSQTWHNSSRAQLRRDCRRYTALVVHGWLVVRFAWEDVMFEPAYVVAALTELTARAHELTNSGGRGRRSA